MEICSGILRSCRLVVSKKSQRKLGLIDGQLSKTGLVLVAVGDEINDSSVQIHDMAITRFFNLDWLIEMHVI